MSLFRVHQRPHSFDVGVLYRGKNNESTIVNILPIDLHSDSINLGEYIAYREIEFYGMGSTVEEGRHETAGGENPELSLL